MKFAQTYSFKSPLAIADMLARLRDLGPWQWTSTGDRSVTANLPPPDHGTIEIQVLAWTNLLALTGEWAAEDLQAIYDTVFTYLLPAIAATDVTSGRIDPPRAATVSACRNFAYRFDSPLRLAEMVVKLNDTGPWPWHERENDRLDDYLSAPPIRSPHRGIARIFVEEGRYVVDVDMESAEPDASSVLEKAERELFERVLPSIGASNLCATEPLD